MNILIIGHGGREHAILEKVKKSSLVDKIYVAKGNAGMKGCTLVDIDEDNNEALVNFALENKINLTIVGPEVSIVNGIVDAFTENDLQIFGPSKKASLIEGSKTFAKELMKKYNIPTAKYEVFSDYESSKEYVMKGNLPIVIKYDGLAAGKGVTVAFSKDEAINALKDIFINKKFGNDDVLIEEYLEGEEFSLMAFVNGENVYPMVEAKDHKRAFDNNEGPNTGGMGAFSPVGFVTKEVYDNAVINIMEKTAKAMVQEKTPFTGILYGGLILSKDGPKVIEFNARFGDPETEVVLPRLENDLVQVILDVLNSKDPNLKWSNDTCLGVVMASKGYPEDYKKNFLIEFENEIECFHMGTKLNDGLYYTDGGRVLFVLGKGKNIDSARINAYNSINKIKCDNLFYRKDIGLSK